MVDAVPCANRLNGATLGAATAIGALLTRNVRMPFSDCSIEKSIPNICIGRVVVNPVDNVGSLARKMNMTASHIPTSISVLRYSERDVIPRRRECRLRPDHDWSSSHHVSNDAPSVMAKTSGTANSSRANRTIPANEAALN